MAAPAHDQTGHGNGNGAGTYTLTTITIAANSVVYVKTHVSNTGTAVPSATGLTFVQVGSDLTSSNGISRLYRAFTGSTLTSNTVTITTTSFPQSSATIDTFTGVDTTGTNGSGATGATNTFTSGGSNAPTANVTTTRDNSLVAAFAGETGSLTWTAGTNQTIDSTDAGPGFSTSASEHRNSGTATSGTVVTGNFSLSGSGAVDLFVVEILSPVAAVVVAGGVSPLRIPNPFVGPQAMRFLMKNRMPQTLPRRTVGPLFAQPVDGGVSFTGAQTKSTRHALSATLTFDRYKSVILSDTPIGYWRLDDSGSTVVDQMGTYPGAFQGTNTQQASGLLVGDSNTALSMAGAGGTLFTQGNTPVLSGDWSVECWVNLSSLVNGKSIVDIANNATPFPQNFVLSNGGYAGGTNTMFALGYGSNALGFSALFTPANTVVAGQTYHVVGTYVSSSKLWSLYVNGGLSNSRTTASAPPTGQSGEVLTMGNNGAGSAGMSGTLDEVAIYNYALTPTQVNAHYLTGQDLMNKQTRKISSGALSFVGAIVKSTSRSLAGAVSFAGSAVKSIIPTALTASVGFVGNLIGGSLHTLALAAALSFTGGLSMRTSKILSSGLSFSGSLPRLIRKGLSGGVSFAGSLLKRTAHILTSAGLSFTGTLTKGAIHTLALASAALSFSGTITKNTGKKLSGGLSFAATLTKLTKHGLAGALSFIGAITHGTQVFIVALSAGLSFVGSLNTRTSKGLTATLSFTGSFGKLMKLARTNLSASLGFTGSIRKQTGKSLLGSVSFSASLTRAIAKNIASALSFTVSFLTKHVYAPVLTFVPLVVNLVTSVLSSTESSSNVNPTVTSTINQTSEASGDNTATAKSENSSETITSGNNDAAL